jgi:hypothetical protein
MKFRDLQRQYNADEFFAELDQRSEYQRKNAFHPLHWRPDPLNLAFKAWVGGEPRSDWRADTGVPCWNPMRAAA